MIDLCTIVFRDELPILQVQAQSIDLYGQNLGVQSIYVIVNDDRDVADQIDPAWWGSMADRVNIIHRSAYSNWWVDNGWVSQQVLKLLGAATSFNTYTMILDAKTILIKKLGINDLLTSDQRLVVGQVPVWEVFTPSKNIVNQLFNIDLQLQAGPGGVPYFFHNNTVRSMIVDVTQITQQCFPTWFQQQGMLTEYILYSGYILYKHGTLDYFYTNDAWLSIMNVCHSEVAQYDTKLSEVAKNDSVAFGVHRRAWTQLTADQQQAYRDFLISKNISSACILN